MKRLRPYPTPERLTEIYAKPHDHRLYGRGHQERVDATIALGRTAYDDWTDRNIADLSCGNAAIARGVAEGTPATVLLGDFAAGYSYRGPLEHTIGQLPAVDLFVCSETLEHVKDPAEVLRLVSATASRLLLSTPIDAWGDTNEEHVWAWSREDVQQMAWNAARWTVMAHAQVDSREYGEPYCYGIWLFS